MRYEKWTFTTIPNIKIISWLNPIVQTIYMHLCHRANQDWICFPSQKKLSKDVWVSKSTLRKHMEVLIEIWILRKTRRFNDENDEETTCEYEIIVGMPLNNMGISGNNTPPPRSEIGISSNDRGVARNGNITKTIQPKPVNNNTKVLEEKSSRVYWNPEINEIIKSIKDNNWGIIDGTVANSRKYWKLLRDKISKIKWFDWNYYSFIERLIKNTDEFQIWKTTSCEKIYYNLASLIAKIKSKKENKMNFEKEWNFDFLWNEKWNIGISK